MNSTDHKNLMCSNKIMCTQSDQCSEYVSTVSVTAQTNEPCCSNNLVGQPQSDRIPDRVKDFPLHMSQKN